MGLSYLGLFLNVEFEGESNVLLVLLNEVLVVHWVLAFKQRLEQLQNCSLQCLVHLYFEVGHDLRSLLLKGGLNETAVILVDLQHRHHVFVEEIQVSFSVVFGKGLVDFEEKGYQLCVLFVLQV